MIKYLIAFMLFASSCLAGMGIGVFPYPGPGCKTVSCSGGVDGALGITVGVDSDWDSSSASTPVLRWSSFIPSSDGLYTTCNYSVHYNETGSSRCVLMDTSGNVLDYSELKSAPGVDTRTAMSANMLSPYCLVSGTTYLLAVWIDSDPYSGVGIGPYSSGKTAYRKDGVSWNTTSFDISSPTSLSNRQIHVNIQP